MKMNHLVLPSILLSSLAASGTVISMGDYLISDNLLGGASDVSYSETGITAGGQDTGQPDSWSGDRRWGNGGAGDSANWAFDGLGDGVYDVYASWKNGGQTNVSTAHYTGTDGFVAIDLDQRLGAAAFPGVVINDGANDVNFASLGQVTVADGTFTLTVDDSVTGADANTFIFADAVAIKAAVPEPSSLALLGLGMISLLRRRR